MSTLSIAPSYTSKVSYKPRTLVAQFGDGYAQRSVEGINSNPQMWNLTFVVTPAQADTLEALFNAANGVSPISWTTPGGLVGKFIAFPWDRTYDTYGQHTVTVTLTQDFAP